MDKITRIYMEPCGVRSLKEFKGHSLENFVQGRMGVEDVSHDLALAEADNQFRAQLAWRQSNVYDIYNWGSQDHLGWSWTAAIGGVFHHLHLIVRPEHRRRGISRLVALEVDSEACALGFDKVWGHVFASEDVALQSHISNGFKVTSKILLREVSNEPS